MASWPPWPDQEALAERLSRTNAPHGLPGEDRVWGGWIKMFSGKPWRILRLFELLLDHWINMFIGSYLFYIIVQVTIVIMMILLFFDDVNYRSLVWKQLGDHGFHEDILLADFSSQPSSQTCSRGSASTQYLFTYMLHVSKTVTLWWKMLLLSH